MIWCASLRWLFTSLIIATTECVLYFLNQSRPQEIPCPGSLSNTSLLKIAPRIHNKEISKQLTAIACEINMDSNLNTVVIS